ncbi:ribonuclease R [Anaeromassilibacillus senegalensis]|uniref:Ribonuclease R n=1 Tax=Anaeromassilibacillus senegalensis TaxID=1673717 RepID=A0ABS9MJ34_9FIRM|nr:ribonuclease R [Anaeromassilibacillus senegalensis]MCG4610815.1 ribonuclease R [Anaeromassilibacillus senegalensis]
MLEEMKDQILKFVQKTPQAMTSRGLMKKMRVKDPKLFYRAMDQLRQQGVLQVNKKHRVRLAASSARSKRAGSPREKRPFSGTLREKLRGPVEKIDGVKRAVIVSLSKGFAFARPEDGGEDLFIHADHLKSAFIGDTVVLNHLERSGKGLSADVEQITERASRLLTGTLVEGEEGLEFAPDDAIRYNIPLSRKSLPHLRPHVKAQAEIQQIPGTDRLTARVIKVYGSSDSAKICADAIIDQNGIRTEFPEEVLAEAEKIRKAKITEKDRKGRLDLRGLGICTIDGPDAKDLDDAISVSRTRLGYRLGVHIADVSHYVKAGSAIDLEARERGTSVYFADRVIPMLPEALSNGVCSLNAGEDKLTFSAIIELDKQGTILSFRFRKSIINSKVRGVYGEVNQLFNGTADKALRKKYSPVIRSLHAARELAEILKARAKRSGTVELDSTESRFVLDGQGVCVDVQPRESGEAEQMIEQLMITANQAAAQLAKRANLPFVYRIHEQPAPDRVESLADLVGALGLNPVSLRHSASVKTADFAAIMEQAEGTPAQKVISHQLLRTMAKARYDTQPVGHFGLALEDYCHFTSPIRRYPDTAIHRILSAYLAKDKQIAAHYTEFAREAASNSSKCEVRAMAAERSAEDCYMAEYMRQHIGEEATGVISGVTMRGVFVELPNTVEGFVPITSFEGAHFEFDGMITQYDATTGRKLTIGQPLRVKAVAADVASGRIDFLPVEPTPENV